MSFSHAALNATLNGTSGILLAGGYAAIRTGKRGLLRISDVTHHSGDRDCAVDSDYAAAWVGGAL